MATVVVGLVFVGYELRQNTKAQRITATQTLAAEYADALEVMAQEGEAACIYALGINGVGNLEDDERNVILEVVLNDMGSRERRMAITSSCAPSRSATARQSATTFSRTIRFLMAGT